jgi:hypothetical protein
MARGISKRRTRNVIAAILRIVEKRVAPGPGRAAGEVV